MLDFEFVVFGWTLGRDESTIKRNIRPRRNDTPAAQPTTGTKTVLCAVPDRIGGCFAWDEPPFFGRVGDYGGSFDVERD